MPNIINRLLQNRYFRAAVYAATGYLAAHSITEVYDWKAAGLAAAMAILGLIHHDTEPEDEPA